MYIYNLNVSHLHKTRTTQPGKLKEFSLKKGQVN